MVPTTPRYGDADIIAQGVTATAAENAVTKATRKKRTSAYRAWKIFCADRDILYTLQGYQPGEVVTALSTYMGLYRLRKLPHQRGNQPIRSRTISCALSSIGSEIARVVEKNPLLVEGTRSWPVHIRDALRGFARDDPPPGRQWPVTLAMLRHMREMTAPKGFGVNQWRAIQDLCVIAFFFLLRPAEFCKTDAEKGAPFYLNELTFMQSNQSYLGHNLPSLNEADLDQATANSVTLMFADQKNGHKGENVSHRPSEDLCICPVRALVRRVNDMRKQGADSRVQYHLFYGPEKMFRPITRDHINTAIKLAATAVRPLTGIDPAHVSASSFRPGGATALLCGKVDKNTIKLLGRWRSDAIDTYLRTAAVQLTSGFSKCMLDNGDFTFLVKDTPETRTARMLQQEHQLPTEHLTKADLDDYYKVQMIAFTKAITKDIRAVISPEAGETNNPDHDAPTDAEDSDADPDE